MVERYAHIAPEALQGAANRLDAFASYANQQTTNDNSSGPEK
jgi:hypothetical protein